MWSMASLAGLQQCVVAVSPGPLHARIMVVKPAAVVHQVLRGEKTE